MLLEQLTTLSDNPDLVREECFYVGWQLRSPNSWQYRDLFSDDEGVVTLENLINKVKQKREAVQNLANPQTDNDRISANKQTIGTYRANAKARKSVPRR